jgi:hypothetical protein
MMINGLNVITCSTERFPELATVINLSPKSTRLCSFKVAIRIGILADSGSLDRHCDLASVISFVYVTPHGFILLGCGPSAAMLVPPAAW